MSKKVEKDISQSNLDRFSVIYLRAGNKVSTAASHHVLIVVTEAMQVERALQKFRAQNWHAICKNIQKLHHYLFRLF